MPKGRKPFRRTLWPFLRDCLTNPSTTPNPVEERKIEEEVQPRQIPSVGEQNTSTSQERAEGGRDALLPVGSSPTPTAPIAQLDRAPG